MDTNSSMRRAVIGAAALTVALAMGAAAGLAWRQERDPMQGGRGPGGPGMSPVFAALDADRDGTVSAAELVGAPVALKTLDRNGDGQLSADEIRPAFGPGGPGGRGPGGRGGRDEPGETPPTSPDELDRDADGVRSQTTTASSPERRCPSDCRGSSTVRTPTRTTR